MTSASAHHSWIDLFSEVTESTGSSDLFRLWAGISAVSGILERRIVLHTARGPLAPNLFVLLTAPPGIGKTVIINAVRAAWQLAPDLRVAPSSITRAGFEDRLIEKSRQVHSLEGLLTYHSLLVASTEFGNLVKEYDTDWINVLNELYDCGSVYDHQTRGGGLKIITNPHIMILAGTQPQYLQHILPANAFGMGFTSRIIMVYASDEHTPQVSVFGEKGGLDFKKTLEPGVTRMMNLSGRFNVGDSAKALIEDLHKKGWPPVPNNPKLQHYNTRRLVHILKLAMCFAAARYDKDVMEHDILRAHKTLVETEALMPQIFSDMVSSGVAELNQEFVNFAIQYYMQTGRKPVPETVLMQYMGHKLPVHLIRMTLEHMQQAGFLEQKTIMSGGNMVTAYIPHAGASQIRQLLQRSEEQKAQ